MRSAVKRVASLLGDDPARIPLDLRAISTRLATVSPVAAGLTSKSVSNIRSNFLAAVKASGLKPIQRLARTPLSRRGNNSLQVFQGGGPTSACPVWRAMPAPMGSRPKQSTTRRSSLHHRGPRWVAHRKPNGLHRRVALIWNEARIGLSSVYRRWKSRPSAAPQKERMG